MTTFVFRALDGSGSAISGKVDAHDINDAIERLQSDGLTPVYVRPPVQGVADWLASRRSKVTPKQASLFVQQFATLMKAGASVLTCLDSLSNSHSNRLVRERCLSLRARLRAGERLSVALKDAFPELPTYIARFVELGELTGQIAATLEAGAKQFTDELRVRDELRSALTYPAFLAVSGLTIVLLMMTFVVPRFSNLVGDLESAPFITRVVISTSVVMSENIALIGVSALFCLGLATVLSQNAAARRRFTGWISNASFLDQFTRKRDLASWSRTVGLALKHGAGLIDALALGEQAVLSARLRMKLKAARKAVRAGRSLDQALLEAARLQEPMLIDMLRTGRGTGATVDLLLFMADQYDQALREFTRRVTALAEPLTILLIAGFVGTIVVSIVLAMTSVYEIAT